MTTTPAGRLEKFRRILPRPDLAPAGPGDPITVVLDPPLDTLPLTGHAAGGICPL